MKNKKGFTLIELLAVIVILGVLLSISVVAVNSIRKKQEEKNKINVISAILTGAKEYVAENPSTLNSLPSEVNVSDLKNGNFVDYDEKKYKDFNSLKISISSCSDDAVGKLMYSLTVDGKTYNDCGCELQPDNENNTYSKNICGG